DYTTAEPARDVIASLITADMPPGPASPAPSPAVPGGAPRSLLPTADVPAAPGLPGQPLPGPPPTQETEPALSQKALGGKLRRDGYRVANHSLRGLLAAASGLTGASSPPEPGKTPAGPAAPGRLANGSDTALASRLPGDQPGSGPARPRGAG